MLSHSEGKKQRKELRRDIDRNLREKAAADLRTLREQLRLARAERDKALDEAKGRCRAERLQLREKAHARRKAVLAELRDTYAKERADARSVCVLRKTEVHAQTKDPIERARGKWEAERQYQAQLRRIDQGNRDRHRAFHHAHAKERRSESDDAVRANLPPDYLILWDRVKRSIKGSARESRTEAFLRYVEENPGALVEALEHDSDRLVRELEAQQAKAERALRAKRPQPVKRRPYTREELAAVPF